MKHTKLFLNVRTSGHFTFTTKADFRARFIVPITAESSSIVMVYPDGEVVKVKVSNLLHYDYNHLYRIQDWRVPVAVFEAPKAEDGSEGYVRITSTDFKSARKQLIDLSSLPSAQDLAARGTVCIPEGERAIEAHYAKNAKQQLQQAAQAASCAA